MAAGAQDRWASRAQVAAWAGCDLKTVDRAIKLDEIDVRPGERTRGMPSLERESAQRWATTWAADKRAKAERRAARPSTGPPDDEHVWLDTATAAVVVGFTVPWMRRLAEMERAPATKVGQRWWWRRDLIEASAAARALQQTHGRASQFFQNRDKC